MLKYTCDVCRKEAPVDLAYKALPMSWQEVSFGTGSVLHACSKACSDVLTQQNRHNELKRNMEKLAGVVKEWHQMSPTFPDHDHKWLANQVRDTVTLIASILGDIFHVVQRPTNAG